MTFRQSLFSECSRVSVLAYATLNPFFHSELPCHTIFIALSNIFNWTFIAGDVVSRVRRILLFSHGHGRIPNLKLRRV